MYSQSTRYEYRTIAIKRGKRLALGIKLRSTLRTLIPSKYEVVIAILIVSFGIAYFN